MWYKCVGQIFIVFDGVLGQVEEAQVRW